jgi:hypothetical protein
MVDHFDGVARRVRDEDTPGLWIERAMIEGAAGGIWYLDDANGSQRYERAPPLRREIREVRLTIESWSPPMRNRLETSSVAQSLDGAPSAGEPAFPRIINLALPDAPGKLSDHFETCGQCIGRFRICPFARGGPPPSWPCAG